MIRDFLARDFLAHRVTFRDFMARNFLARDFLGGYRYKHVRDGGATPFSLLMLMHTKQKRKPFFVY